MKRFYLMIAAAALMAAACNKSEVAPEAGGESTVTFTAALPGDIATKATSDGTTADWLNYAVYESGQTTPLITGEQAIPLKTTVTLKLVTGKTYDILFWAAAQTGSPYTFDASAQTVTVDYTSPVANDEKRDAFFAMKTVEVTGSLTETVQLYRPFAQVNVATDDLEDAKTANVDITKSSIEVPAYSTLNLATGAVVGEAATVQFALAAIPADPATITINDKEYSWLEFSYLLVPADKEVVDCKVVLSNEDETYTKELNITNVPVQRNYRTNIYGSLLTATATFNVEIVPDFEEPDYEVNLAEAYNETDLANALANGCDVKLMANVELTSVLTVKGNSVLDLNGYTIANTEALWDDESNAWALISVDGGSIVLTGEGTVSSLEDDCFAVSVMNGGSVVIEGGTYVGNGHCVYVYDGSAEIKGGTFSVLQENCYEYTVNCYDENYKNGTAKVSISGGTFVEFNPGNCNAEGANTSFLAAGYVSVADGDNYVVYKSVGNDGNDMAAAIDAAVENGSNVIYTESAVTFAENVEIDGKGVTIEGAPIYFKGDATIKNMTFANGTNSSNNGSAVYVTAGESKNITFENCTFIDAEWDGIQLTNEDIESVTFKDCYFKNTTQGYRYIHLELRTESGGYAENENAKVSITGCTFENVSTSYCKDSAITIAGFKLSNITVSDNIVKGEGADALSTSIIWISDGTDFSTLMDLDTIKAAFKAE